MNADIKKTQGGPKVFGKISNPHCKNQQKQAPKEQEVHVQDQQQKVVEQEMPSQKEEVKNKQIIEDKNTLAKDLLKQGYVNSFVDFFYVSYKKTPDLKMKYEKEHGVPVVAEPRFLGGYEEKQLMQSLKIAEDFLRNSHSNSMIEKAIDKYMEIRLKCRHYSDSCNAIYFNHKCISLTKRYNLIKPLIHVLITMGDCFDTRSGVVGSSANVNPNDLFLSMIFKEEAKKLFKHLGERDVSLETEIYSSLIKLYEDLAAQQESTGAYERAIEFLQKQLENIENLSKINKDKGGDMKNQIEVYLKVANLNFKMSHFEETLNCLKILQPLITGQDFSNLYSLKSNYLYAQTYEAQGEVGKAIDKLNEIDRNIVDGSSIAGEESTFAKSKLHLGRLHYMQGTLNLAKSYLQSFFKEAKKVDSKESLLDLARVNLGMILGTMGKDEYIRMITSSNFNDFLKLKLKYFSDIN